VSEQRSAAPRVVVIGAGLGGLCLAERLRLAGLEVTVYERDGGPATRRQGYRIHLGGTGATALAQCLPPESYQLFLATAGRSGTQVTVASKRLRTLRVIGGGPAAPAVDQVSPGSVSVPVNRLTLREIMLADLGSAVRFGTEFTSYEPEGRGVRAHFADGGSVYADVLVGADGVGSRVRAALLPAARVRDTGVRAIYGKVRLDDVTRPLLPAQVHQGFLAVTGFPRPVGMALGLVELAGPVAEAGARYATALTPVDDYLMGALTAPARSFPVPDPEMPALDGEQLREVALRMTRRWHPKLRELLARCSAAENFWLPIRVSDPVAAWPPGPVTVLGDAVHAMSPAGGSGANTALRDAALLGGRLSSMRGNLTAAIGGYEQAMLDYGFAAVRASEQAAGAFGRR
jgi:2-polyprenyl-6-methoxyphenol hydroxylase-like FAD-dependent oxidoreductase